MRTVLFDAPGGAGCGGLGFGAGETVRRRQVARESVRLAVRCKTFLTAAIVVECVRVWQPAPPTGNAVSLEKRSYNMLRILSFCSAFLVAAVLGASLLAGQALAEKPKIVVFDFELFDTSLEGELQPAREDQSARLKMISQMIRDALEKSGNYTIVEITPEAEKRAKDTSFLGCNGCDVEIAKTLGADLSIIGHVQKVSNLILSLTAEIRNVKTGKLVGAMGADIRANTDDSWRRGMQWLIDNRLLANQGKLAVQEAE